MNAQLSNTTRGDRIATWLAIGANLGVVLGLALLIIELRQNTKIVEAQMHQSRTEAAMSDQQASYNSDYVPPLLVKVRKGDKLSDEEEIRYEALFRSFNRNMDNQLWQYNHGYLGSNIPRSIRIAVRAQIGSSVVGLENWEQFKLQYTDEYIAFVERAIADLRPKEPRAGM